MKITVITCTGDRPEAIARCREYVARQTIKPIQWIVLDDGDKKNRPVEIDGVKLTYVWKKYWQGYRSMVQKLNHAFTQLEIMGDVVAFFEDDDWYHPRFLERISKHFVNPRVKLVGDAHAIYYNVAHRWYFKHGNTKHTSLCQTAVRVNDCRAEIVKLTEGDSPYIDWFLWTKSGLEGKLFFEDQPFCIGIKGMPGRKGYGLGHRRRYNNAHDDQNLAWLSRMTGLEDAKFYASFTVDHPLIARSECGRVRGPQWYRWIGHLTNEPVVGVELGTFKGDSSEWMLDNVFTHPNSIYHSVDTFEGSVEHARDGIDCTENERITREKLARFGERSRIHRTTSAEFLRSYEGPPLDFIYIDAAHDAMNVMRDAVLAFDLLKPEGTIVFDDYAWTAMPREIDRPKMAIDAFVNCYRDHLNVLEPIGYQYAIEKKPTT